MEKETFRVVFRGEIIVGRNKERVQGDLARTFNLDIDNPRHRVKLERMFCGRPVIIKAGLSDTAAKNYQKVLARAGAICEIKSDTERPERRHLQRRKRGDRRSVRRSSAILPDRRVNKGRRASDHEQD